MGINLRKIVILFFTFAILFSSVEPYSAYKKKEPVKVGIFDMDGFHSYDENGDLTGFCIDYLHVVSGITDWEYEFVEIKDFMEGLEMLENHELDLIAPAMPTDERKEIFIYSELHLGMEYSVLLTMPEREELYYQDYEKYNGLKVAVLEGYPMTDYYISKMQAHNFETELVYVKTHEEAEAALENGDVDAIVTSILYYDEAYKVLDCFYPQPFYFMTYKENEKMIGELNAAMYRIQETYPTLMEELLYTYYPVYQGTFYTRDEVEYIQRGKPLRVAYVSGRKPLSFTDGNGELAGISRELFDRVAELSGLTFKYVELPDGNISYNYLQYNRIDLITGVEYNSANMNSEGVFMSRPYLTARKVLVSKQRKEFSADKNYKVALVEGSKNFRKVVAEHYPNMEVVEYKTVSDCFRALYEEEVDLVLQNQYVVEALMGKPIYSTFAVVPVEGINDELCFSTITSLGGGYGLDNKESAIVISILNKSISQISEIELDNMIIRAMIENPYDETLWDFLYKYQLIILIILFALSIVLCLYIVYLRERKRARIIEENEIRLKELQQRRYQTIIECSDDLIYEISVDGVSSIGSDKIKEKFGWEIPKCGQRLDFNRAMEILHVHPDDEEIFRQSQIANGIGIFDNLTLRLCKADGTEVWCRVFRTLLLDENNKPVSILGKIVDIDAEIREKQSLEKKTRTDLLTGLLNKQTFEKEVREYVETHATESACFVFIDMDHFKEINDKFGHSIGDQVIKETAKKIQLLFKHFDLVGRFGGDEFCVFVKDIPRETLIDRLRFAVAKMEQEYTYDGESVTISASIGAAYCKRASVGYKELMNVADAAAYQAKDNGRNCYLIKDVE